MNLNKLLYAFKIKLFYSKVNGDVDISIDESNFKVLQYLQLLLLYKKLVNTLLN